MLNLGVAMTMIKKNVRCRVSRVINHRVPPNAPAPSNKIRSNHGLIDNLDFVISKT